MRTWDWYTWSFSSVPLLTAHYVQEIMWRFIIQLRIWLHQSTSNTKRVCVTKMLEIKDCTRHSKKKGSTTICIFIHKMYPILRPILGVNSMSYVLENTANAALIKECKAVLSWAMVFGNELRSVSIWIVEFFNICQKLMKFILFSK